MAAVVLIGESAVGSWSGVFLHDDLDASIAAAAAGYIGFSACHAGGRLVGDRLESRFGPGALLRGGGLLAGIGLATVVVAPVFVLTVTGFALFGLGLSVLLPVILRMAGHEGARAGNAGAAAALAHVGTLTYAGMLLGPVLVGWLAQWVGLRATFAGLLLLLGAVFAAGRRAFATPAPVRAPTSSSTPRLTPTSIPIPMPPLRPTLSAPLRPTLSAPLRQTLTPTS
jgi:MFS family permease